MVPPKACQDNGPVRRSSEAVGVVGHSTSAAATAGGGEVIEREGADQHPPAPGAGAGGTSSPEALVAAEELVDCAVGQDVEVVDLVAA
jgi:hypothetical protein